MYPMWRFTCSGWKAMSKPATLPVPDVGLLTEEAEYLARTHREGDVVHGGEGAEAFGQPFHGYYLIIYVLVHRACSLRP